MESEMDRCTQAWTEGRISGSHHFLLYTSVKETMMLDLLSLTQLFMRNTDRHFASLLFASRTAEGMCHGEHLICCQTRKHLGAGAKALGLRAAQTCFSTDPSSCPCLAFMQLTLPSILLAYGLKIFISEHWR